MKNILNNTPAQIESPPKEEAFEDVKIKAKDEAKRVLEDARARKNKYYFEKQSKFFNSASFRVHPKVKRVI